MPRRSPPFPFRGRNSEPVTHNNSQNLDQWQSQYGMSMHTTEKIMSTCPNSSPLCHRRSSMGPLVQWGEEKYMKH